MWYCDINRCLDLGSEGVLPDKIHKAGQDGLVHAACGEGRGGLGTDIDCRDDHSKDDKMKGPNPSIVNGLLSVLSWGIEGEEGRSRGNVNS